MAEGRTDQLGGVKPIRGVGVCVIPCDEQRGITTGRMMECGVLAGILITGVSAYSLD